MTCITRFYSVVVGTERISCRDLDTLWRTLVADQNPYIDDIHRKPNGQFLPGLRAYFDDLLVYTKKVKGEDLPISIEALVTTRTEPYHVPPSAMEFWIAEGPCLAQRRLARTESNSLALVPKGTSMGDIFVVFRGVPLPFVLRNQGDGYRTVGVSYAYDLMDGEALEQGLEEEDSWLR